MKRSNPLALAKAFIIAQGGTVQHTPRDDKVAHALLAETYHCLLCGTDHPIVGGRVEHCASSTPERPE